MANIRVDLSLPVEDGQTVTFKSPANCSQVTGLIVYYPERGITTSKTFQFADAHGNNLGGKNLFAAGVLVKVILDTELSRAYVQNADTNAYLEGRFAEKYGSDNEPAKLLWTNGDWTAPFDSTTVTIYDLSQYDGIEVVFVADPLDGSLKSTGFIPLDSNTVYFTLDSVYGLAGTSPTFYKRMGHVATSSGASYSNLRFEKGMQFTIAAPSLKDNNVACVPYKVYGVMRG